MTRLAIQTIATVILGMSAVGLMLSTLVMRVIPPYQWYPVGVYHIRLLVTPNQVLVIPPDREVPEAIELPNPQPGFLSVDATVTLERPIPQVSSGRSGWKQYSPSYNQPSSDAIKKAGPERAATVHLSAHTSFPKFTMLSWTTGNPPTRPMPVDSVIPARPDPRRHGPPHPPHPRRSNLE